MTNFKITKIEYSLDGDTYISIPLQGDSAEFNQSESDDEQGRSYTQSLFWRYSSARYYESGKVVAIDLRRAKSLQLTCLDKAIITISPDELTPTVSSQYFFGNAPGEFAGWEWSYTLVDAVPFTLSFF